MKVYLSSTLKDLAQHRAAAAGALRKIRHEVICMEDYVARDEQTRAGCEHDVERCDIYVGVFAWRYGFVPKRGNPEGTSITEFEYRRAIDVKKPCLVFLLPEEAEWPEALRDPKRSKAGQRVRALRTLVSERLTSAFTTPDTLATEVIAAVHQLESTRRVKRLEVLDEIKTVSDIGVSYLPDIQARIIEAQNEDMVELSLGPVPWWTTRLHLVAALASDFTRIRQFVFLNADGGFIAMASPTEVRRALGKHQPRLERAYLDSRPIVHPGELPVEREVEHIATKYSTALSSVFGTTEENAKALVSPLLLTRDLGIEPSADIVQQRHDRRALLNLEILKCRRQLVALLEHDRLVSVIDRTQMATRIAIGELEQHVD